MSRRLDRAHDRGVHLALVGTSRARFRGLVRALDLHLHLARMHAGALYRVLERDGASDLDRDRAIDRDRARSLYRDLDPAHDLIRALMSDDAHALDLTLGRARDLYSNVSRDLYDTRTRHVLRALGRCRATAHASALVDRIEGAHEVVTTVAAALNAVAMTGGAVQESRAASERVSGAAVRVVLRTVRVLPACDRARYRQEYLAELYTLAQEQTSRRAQLGHALRAAARMWSLRRALRAPRPGRERSR